MTNNCWRLESKEIRQEKGNAAGRIQYRHVSVVGVALTWGEILPGTSPDFKLRIPDFAFFFQVACHASDFDTLRQVQPFQQ